LAERIKAQRFEQLVMPHLDSAYNLARWLTHNQDDAQDVLQEACLRAYKYFGSFAGENPRAWLLKIVRNTYYTWLQTNRAVVSLDTDAELPDCSAAAVATGSERGSDNPETILLEARAKQQLRHLVGRIPCAYREILVLRLMEDMSYRDIAASVGIPIGTVMSRLARARQHLLKSWAENNSSKR
jgi:RNA polymerase sigma-70 factor (ECF subfamily)